MDITKFFGDIEKRDEQLTVRIRPSLLKRLREQEGLSQADCVDYGLSWFFGEMTQEQVWFDVTGDPKFLGVKEEDISNN